MGHYHHYMRHAAWCEEMQRIEAEEKAARLEKENEDLKKELKNLKENDSISNSCKGSK